MRLPSSPRDLPSSSSDIPAQERNIRPPRLFSGLLYGVAALLAGGIGWMAVAPAEAPPTGSGAVLPRVAARLVESPDAGRAMATLVREGGLVNAGDILVRLRPTVAPSADPGRLERRFQLLATIARLEAVARLGTDQAAVPPVFPVDLMAERPGLVERETARLAAEASVQQALVAGLQRDLARQRLALGGIRDEGRAVEQRLALLDQRLAGNRPGNPADLARAASDVGTAVDDVAARSTTAETAMAVTASRLIETGQASRQRALAELDRRRIDLADVEALIAADRDRAGPVEIRAPIRGVVRRLWPGGNGSAGPGGPGGAVPTSAVAAGAPLMEIVPSSDEQAIVTWLSPADAARIRIGQAVRIRLTSPGADAIGTLPATVEQVGAQPLDIGDIDEAAGSQMAGNQMGVPIRVRLAASPQIAPGMTAMVEVLTDRPTILTGLLRPALDRPTDRQISSLPEAGGTAGN